MVIHINIFEIKYFCQKKHTSLNNEKENSSIIFFYNKVQFTDYLQFELNNNGEKPREKITILI